MREEGRTTPLKGGSVPIMRGIVRWWQESQQISLKCERVGHREVTKWRKGWMQPEYSWGSVADRVRQECGFCTRCRANLTDWSVTDRRALNSLSAPDATWEAIERGGYWHTYGTVATTPGKPSSASEGEA